MDTEKNQISLSMKSKSAPRRERAPRREAVDLSKYEAMDSKDQLEATVKNCAAFGAFVEFEDGVQGLVHISRLSEGRVENVEDVVKVSSSDDWAARPQCPQCP